MQIPEDHEARVRAMAREIVTEAPELPPAGFWDYWTVKRAVVFFVLVGCIFGPMCWIALILLMSWLVAGSPDALIRVLMDSPGL